MATKKLIKKALAPHVIVYALAGTGKSTTIEWAIKGVPPHIICSPEQEAIIAAINEGKYKSVRICAFNKHIATEMQSRLSTVPGVEVTTNHSLGLRIIKKNVGYTKVDSYKCSNIFQQLYGDIDKAKDKRAHFLMMKDVEELVNLCKVTMTGTMTDTGWRVTPAQLMSLQDEYGLDNPASPQMVDEVIRESSTNGTWIDFADMVFLPAANQWEVPQVDVVIGDETQDLNKAQHYYMLNGGDRAVVVGDTHQAIYAFGGASSQSMPDLVNALSSSSRKVVCLPLTETRRCPKLVVQEANRYVPQLRAHESNPMGKVQTIPDSKLLSYVHQNYLDRETSMILCRVNAPLASYAFSCIRQKIPAYIRGKNIGTRLVRTVKGFKQDEVIGLLDSLHEYQSIEETKLLKSKALNRDEKLIALSDQCSTIEVLCEGLRTTEQVVERIESLFSDEAKKNAICLSSVHASKGLEAQHISIIKPELLPHPKLSMKSPVQAEQERNLRYIASTRSQNILNFITSSQDSDE